MEPDPEPVRIPVTDIFDLHSIPPRDVKAVVEEYLLEAHRLLAVTRKRIFLDGGRHTGPPEGGKGKAACARVRRK